MGKQRGKGKGLDVRIVSSTALGVRIASGTAPAARTCCQLVWPKCKRHTSATPVYGPE